MAPTLPLSLSPHVCILSTPDLNEVLEKSSLPPLQNILQSFSPLPKVTTRTSSLMSIPHDSFALRFSDLIDVEEACLEDEEQRTSRTIDWMTARIGKRCGKWVQDTELMGDKETTRTPWWDELRRCAEGDFVPSKAESWNHPVALILAVSTTSPNPLQAITALHARNVQFPAWVDTNFLRYTLIIHPQNSNLSDEEATALHNAVKRQFGLHSYLLPLVLPKAPPSPVPVPALMPRLPPPPSPDSPPHHSSIPSPPLTPGNLTAVNTLRMEERDIQQTARFTREFLVMSLIPWMEKCVAEWNENFSSTRRLPSRLFSSTRRLFGSQISSSAHTPPISASTASLPGRASISSGLAPPSQQRRLAEFSTILGDFKLAVVVWEALRKESKGGSDILPLLLTPGPTVPLHVQTAISSIYSFTSDLPPHAQLRGLSYAVRWEAGIAPSDFVSPMLEGERWLVWAASNAEEAPLALLLAHAALLSAKKGAWRRAALWYVLAATRLEKCGIKPLTMYFLRKAQDIYRIKPPKELSPSFWESEGKSPSSMEGLEDIMSGIEHPLGRLLYTTGDVSGAVKLFLGLLRGSAAFSSSGSLMLDDGTTKIPNDKLYLDDFKVAYNYWKSTNPDQAFNANLQIPLKLCSAKDTRLRFPGDSINEDTDVWASRKDDWISFWMAQGGKSKLASSGKVSTNELFWVDLIMKNPLDAEVRLSNVTLVVTVVGDSSTYSFDDDAQVEVIKEVILGPKASVLVPISVESKGPAKLQITHAKYDFLTQLQITEPLASRGRRLHDTPLQRQRPTYAPDVVMQVEVVPSDHKLNITYIEDGRLVLFQGENKAERLWLTNAGTHPIREVWMISGADDEISMGSIEPAEYSTTPSEIVESVNSLRPLEPRRLSLGASKNTILQPGDQVEVPLVFHAGSIGNSELSLLFVFREDESQPFYSTKLARPYEVLSLFETSVTARPSRSQDHVYVLDVDITNTSQTRSVNITQITTISPQWTCSALSESNCGTIPPSQSSRLILGASPWLGGSGSNETLSFICKKLDGILKGGEIESSRPSPIKLQCNHISLSPRKRLIHTSEISNFIHSGRRNFVSQNISQVHSYISSSSYPTIFPLYNPAAVDLVIFWELPSHNISGHLNVHGITLGAGHAALEGILEEAESAKVKRSMYAETRRENMEVLGAIRGSEWNTEMNPVALSLKGIGTKSHDFEQGPCQVSVEFQLRNYSLTLPADYILKLQSEVVISTDFLPPPYLGRLTFRGTIPPSGTVTVQPRLWITRPGTYSLGGWTLETAICIPPSQDVQSSRARHYLQEPSTEQERVCAVVHNFQTSEQNRAETCGI
ncbi:hypothetical protein BDN70DRAFT_883515 [Pholiota conissans]|uniref:Uncharacterized protein n=1 Tax=Pholiota conissans TaxID=109636 RepID=A0A9P6CWW2_9AGAR|nr:hypothetical protein BDN70DRAFT_883515 [Pholiota conissans]